MTSAQEANSLIEKIKLLVEDQAQSMFELEKLKEKELSTEIKCKINDFEIGMRNGVFLTNTLACLRSK